MSLFDQFETNNDKEVEGVDVQYAPNKDGTIPTFTISRMSKANKKYQKYMEKRTKPYARQLQLGTMDEETAQNMFQDIFITTVLKGWSNVRGRDGKDLAFTKENAAMVMQALPDLYEDLEAKSKSAALFRNEEDEDDAKKLIEVLAYLFEQTPASSSVLRQMRRAGEKMPEAQTNMPELRLGLELYIEAFFELDSERTHGETLNPIPSSAIRLYARDYEYNERQAEDLMFFIREMDTAHLKRLGKKLKEKSKHGPNTVTPSRPPRKSVKKGR